MEGAEEELERRSKFLSSLIQKKKSIEQQEQHDHLNVRVRASDMPFPLQNRAFRCARDHLDSMPGKLDSKRVALALKKEFDSAYGPAWHCIVGTSFGSYVTHSTGGFLYFSIDKEMEISHVVEDKEHQAEDEVPTVPREALFLVLAYLPLFELLAMSEVCVSLRDAVHKDVLPWLDNIIVERPLNLRLSDEILMKITSKAIGRLKTLALVNCLKITDDGLQWVIDKNPLISKLYIPACTGLTPEGVIRAVKTLSEGHHSLKSLRINGIYNIKKEHLETILSYLQMNLSQQDMQRKQQPTLYHNRNFPIFRNEESDHDPMLDVDICPKCNDVRVVYECLRETCKRKTELPSTECRGCNLCILRCEECGRCTGSEEPEETACGDDLCSECWLQLPKCNFCNRPYCNQHTNRQYKISSSTGFVCDVCHISYC